MLGGPRGDFTSRHVDWLSAPLGIIPRYTLSTGTGGRQSFRKEEFRKIQLFLSFRILHRCMLEGGSNEIFRVPILYALK